MYNTVEEARLLINAHRSATVYSTEMQRLIGCQAVLLKFKRGLELRPDTTGHVDPGDGCLPKMVGYLRALSDEYAKKYEHVDLCHRYDRAVMSRRLHELAAEKKPFTDIRHELILGDTERFLCDRREFPALTDLTDCGEQYFTNFVNPLHALAAHLLDSAGASSADNRPNSDDDAAYKAFEDAVTACVRRINNALAPGSGDGAANGDSTVASEVLQQDRDSP